MNTPGIPNQQTVQDLIQAEIRRDRLVRWVCIVSWILTFLVLIFFGVVIGQDVSRTMASVDVGIAQPREVLQAAVPLFVVVGTTTLLLALVSTAVVFLRQRTASLADIQIRLASLEMVLTKELEPESRGGQ